MSPQLALTLKALKETRVLEAGMAGQKISEWIFLGPTRQRMSNELVRKAFRGCLTAAELRQVRFHDLRHTFASLLIQQRANPKYIQQQLGHGSISITLDIYSPLFEGDHQHHVHQLDDAQEPEQQEVVKNTESATQAQPEEAGSNAGSWEPIDVSQEKSNGGVTERPNVPVLKTGDLARGPRVQISPPPPCFNRLAPDYGFVFPPTDFQALAAITLILKHLSMDSKSQQGTLRDKITHIFE